MNTTIRNWWVTNGERDPIGPVSTELLIEGIKADKVPGQCWVCLVGETAWRKLTDIPEFLAAVTNASKKPAVRSNLVDAERTVADAAPFSVTDNDAVPLRPKLPRTPAERDRYPSVDFDDEKTIVDSRPPQSDTVF